MMSMLSIDAKHALTLSSVAKKTFTTASGSPASNSRGKQACGVDGSVVVSAPSNTLPTRANVSMSRVNQPQVSNPGDNGMQPSSDTRAWVGRKPIRPQWLAGARTEPPVSVPRAKSHSQFDTADAAPELDPPVTRSGAAPLRGAPKCAFLPVDRKSTRLN